MHISQNIQYCTDMDNFFRTTQLPLLRRRTTRLRRRRTTSLPRTPTSSRSKDIHTLWRILLFILSVSTSHQPSLRFWYHLNLNLVCEESFGLTWLSCPGGAGDPIWAHLGGQLPRHQGKAPSQHLPRHQGHSSSHIDSPTRVSWISPAKPLPTRSMVGL